MEKKTAALVAALLLTLSFTACSFFVPLPAGSSQAPGSASSGTGLPSAAPSSGAGLPRWPATFRQDDFLAFFGQDSYSFPFFINFSVSAPQDLQNNDQTRKVYTLLANYLIEFDTKNGTPMLFDPTASSMIQPVDRLEALSKEIYGFQYDFTHALTLTDTKVENYIAPYMEFDWQYFPRVDQNSVTYANGVITVQAVFWTNRYDGGFPRSDNVRIYEFRYLPENEYCPYQLVSVTDDGTFANGIPPSPPAPVVAPEQAYRAPVLANAYAEGGLNLREGPGEEYKSIQLMPNSASLWVLGQNSDEYFPSWIYVEYAGTQGWAYAPYIYMAYPG